MSSAVLATLSSACRSHARCHGESSPVPPTAPEDGLPEKCAQALRDLRSLVPRVEAAHRAPGYGGKSSVRLEDVTNLCGFYRSVIAGTFCPHASYLFHWGKHATEGEG